jgi:hypothetical protein
MANENHLVLLGLLGAAAYLTRSSWLPAVETDLGISTGASGATGTSTLAPTIVTAVQPIGPNTPSGATPLGTAGCYQYGNGTDGSVIITCPPGVAPPPTTTQNNCANGFTLDASGVCTKYPDAYLLANLNSIPWTGLSDIPSEQINRIDPQILSIYATTTGINSGTALAYVLGLGGAQPDGTMAQGSDGNIYQSLGGVFYRQGTASNSTTPGLGRLGTIASALPITDATLIMASASPQVAALVGRDQRAMLTAAQWNAYYTQATGIVQGIPLNPVGDAGALMSAEQYQAQRTARGLQVVAPRLGLIRNARRGAFPLGGLRGFTQWVPPVNRTIYQIPGRGAVPAGRGGSIPPSRFPNLGVIQDGGGNHRWGRSPFPRPDWWRTAE